jgi:hypothetical protein
MVVALDWKINAEPEVTMPGAVVITTKRDVIVKYNGPLLVRIGPLDHDITPASDNGERRSAEG